MMVVGLSVRMRLEPHLDHCQQFSSADVGNVVSQARSNNHRESRLTCAFGSSRRRTSYLVFEAPV